MKVSIAITTYLHQEFIADALDSVISQERDWPMEIVVGVDKCDDRTAEIVTEYEKRHPELIFPEYHSERILGLGNFISVLRRCRGEFIAMLDGDDLMKPGKLAKQVKFLDSHVDFSMVGHNLRIFNSDDNRTLGLFNTGTPKISTMRDLVRNGTYIGNCSVMYRAKYVDIDLFQKLHAGTHGDWLMHIIVARNGPIGFIDEILGEYRKHAGGVTASHSHASGIEKVRDIQLGVLSKALLLGGSEADVDYGKARLCFEISLNAFKNKNYLLCKNNIEKLFELSHDFSAKKRFIKLISSNPIIFWIVSRIYFYTPKGLKNRFLRR